MAPIEEIKNYIEQVGYIVQGRGPYFLDDSEILEVSKKLGLQTHHFSSLFLEWKEPEFEYNHVTGKYEMPKPHFIAFAYDSAIIPWKQIEIKEGIDLLKEPPQEPEL